MKTKTVEASRATSPAAGAVILWCVLAAALVASLLLLEPPEGRGLEFWNPAGAFTLLADLAVFYCVFILPVFPRREKRSPGAVLESLGVVLFTTSLGLVMLNDLVGQGIGAMTEILLFILLVAAGVTLWAETLGLRLGVYYSSAALAAFGAPLLRFFMDELLRVDARWLDVVSPFTAWPHAAAAGNLSMASWTVCAVVFVSGGLAFLIHRRGRAVE